MSEYRKSQPCREGLVVKINTKSKRNLTKYKETRYKLEETEERLVILVSNVMRQYSEAVCGGFKGP